MSLGMARVCLAVVLIWIAGSHGQMDLTKNHELLVNADHWLMSKRLPDYGWGISTPRVMATLGVIYNSTQRESLVFKLMGKQLELHVLSKLINRKNEPLTAGNLALYIMGLMGTCKDPGSFYNHNLVAMLQHLVSGLDYEFALSSLGLCLSGGHIRKRHLKKLLELMQADTYGRVETLSLATMAVKCIADTHNNKNLGKYVDYSLDYLTKTQRLDGTFGGVASTVVALSAFIGLGVQDQLNLTSAYNSVYDSAASDGSFSNLPTTVDTMLVLSNKSLLALYNMECPETPVNSTEGIIPDLIPNKEPENNTRINITYLIWIGNPPNATYELPMTVPANANFYQIMLNAAELDSNYAFESSIWPNGHFIHTINGVTETKDGYNFWMLYRLKERPEYETQQKERFPKNPDSVDNLYPSNGDFILFWFKQI